MACVREQFCMRKAIACLRAPDHCDEKHSVTEVRSWHRGLRYDHANRFQQQNTSSSSVSRQSSFARAACMSPSSDGGNGSFTTACDRDSQSRSDQHTTHIHLIYVGAYRGCLESP